MKFYDPKDPTKEICANDFVEKYSSLYFIGSPDFKSAKGKKVGKTSRDVEDVIIEILNNGIQADSDVIKILAWKLGKIRQEESVKDNFEYYKDWSEDQLHGKSYGHELELADAAGTIRGEFTCLREQSLVSFEEAQKVFGRLKEIFDTKDTKGIGTTYLLTLLYFVSGGKYPIYDRFAAMAVKAITGDCKPGSEVSIDSLPDKSKTKDIVMSEDSFYRQYINALNKVFENYEDGDIARKRNIDQALWVYGHAFVTPGKRNVCC